ncbi:hypothetical protein Taro_030909 [Colocasia esculenta]|uniref:Uncharacterized protein n=1 Tax=Colocasia esculenta TaxID=4460 RepID=A0A843VQE9_COLES|nr:hypothetical protein [Colocasia esculenta]
MNFKLRLDKYKLMEKLESQMNWLHLHLEDGSSFPWTADVQVWRVVVKGNTQVRNIWRSRIEIFSSSVDSKICICRQMQTDLQKAEDWASRETVSCVDLSTSDLVLSTVPAALAGEGLVIPTGPCSQGSLPLLPSSWGSSSRELGVGWVAEAAMVPCAVNSSESECCELLYLSESRVLFKFSTYLTRLFLLTLPGLRIHEWRCELRGPLQGVREVGSLHSLPLILLMKSQEKR